MDAPGKFIEPPVCRESAELWLSPCAARVVYVQDFDDSSWVTAVDGGDNGVEPWGVQVRVSARPGVLR